MFVDFCMFLPVLAWGDHKIVWSHHAKTGKKRSNRQIICQFLAHSLSCILVQNNFLILTSFQKDQTRRKNFGLAITVYSKSPSNTSATILSIAMTIRTNFANTVWKVNKNLLRGHLISKCLLGVIVWTKKPTKFFQDFCPSL